MRVKVELVLEVPEDAWAQEEGLGDTAQVPQDVANYIVSELISVSNAAQRGLWECTGANGRKMRTPKP